MKRYFQIYFLKHSGAKMKPPIRQDENLLPRQGEFLCVREENKPAEFFRVDAVAHEFVIDRRANTQTHNVYVYLMKFGMLPANMEKFIQRKNRS